MLALFKKLDHYLATHQQYWRYQAFPLQDYPDFDGNEQLAELLKGIDDVKLNEYQSNPQAIYPILKQVIPSLLRLDDPLFTATPYIKEQAEAPFWFKKGIKGRKWTQINHFSAHIDGQQPILEWCAGKGHLGRLIHHKAHVPVTAVEWNEQLCLQGNMLAESLNIPQTFEQANVLTGEANNLLQPHQHAIALHACGDLHVHLLKQATNANTEKISISPCCYHLIQHDVYQPVSFGVKSSSILLNVNALTKQDLKFSVSQQSTSGERQVRLNNTEVIWRLSFDSLQRELLNTHTYMNVPSFPKVLLTGDFKDFVQWVIDKKSLKLDVPSDLTSFLAQGMLRFNQLRRLELVSRFFQRPLELWLVLDRALYLQESGYHVQVSTFCEPNITPRNLLIQASRN